MSAENTARESAKRVFAEEFNDSSHQFKESDGEMAPNYTLLRSGDKANRVFLVGTLTEKEDVGNDSEYWRARVVDPTGTFFVYAGQYQPEAASVLRDIEPPQYVAVVGKVDSYEGDEGDIMLSVKPEDIAIVDEDTRDRWVAETAEATLGRLQEDEIDDGERDYVGMAEEIYGGRDAVREYVVDALEEFEGIAPDDEEDE